MGLVADMIGGPPVYLYVAGVGNITADQFGTVTIRRGRSEADQRVEPSTMTVTVKRAAFTTLPEVGQYVQVNMTNEALAHFATSPGFADRRFGGTVTDAEVVLGPGGENVVNLIAVGALVNVAGQTFDPSTVAAGGDGAQAGAIVNQLDHVVFGGAAGPGSSVTLLAPDASVTTATDALSALSDASGGELVEDRRNGNLVWVPASWRTQSFGFIPRVYLTGAEVVVPLTWTKTLSGMVNDLTLTYGAADPQATYSLTDEWAIGKYGRAKPTEPVVTRLADSAGARARAEDVVGRRGRPQWRAPDLAVDLLRSAVYPTATNLLDNDYFTQVIELSALPADSPFADRAYVRLWREGETETIGPDAWTMDLYVTDYGVFGAEPTWADLTWTWATIPDPAMSWLGIRGYYPAA